MESMNRQGVWDVLDQIGFAATPTGTLKDLKDLLLTLFWQIRQGTSRGLKRFFFCSFLVLSVAM